MINVMINGLAEGEYLEIVTISKIPLLLAEKRNKVHCHGLTVR